MRLEEIQRWRNKLGLPALQQDRLTGEYFTYEKGRFSQAYYFNGDGFLAWVQLL